MSIRHRLLTVSHNRLVKGALAATALAAGPFATPATAATVVQYTEVTTVVDGAPITIFTKPTDDSGAFHIASGVGNAVWFTEITTSDLVKFTASGKATIFPTKSGNAAPEGIVEGPDGNMWFTEWSLSNVAKMNGTGHSLEYNVGISPLQSIDICVGPDNNLWFGTDFFGIGRITTSGISTIFSIGDNSSQVTDVTTGPDGNIWFVETNGPNVGKITTSGAVTEYNVGFVGEAARFGIAAGADGRLWFPDPPTNRIGAINTDGSGLTWYGKGITAQPAVIVAGPDGYLYFGELNGAIGRISTKGVAHEVMLPGNPGANFAVLGITVGPDGNIWFTNNAHAQIGRLKL